MLNIVHMKVNGKEVELAVDERESLLDTLRSRLGLTSVKKGCEVGECGACTVLVNGEAIDSCIYLTMWAGAFPHPEGLYRGGGGTVRILYAGPDHERGGDRGNGQEVQPGGA